MFNKCFFLCAILLFILNYAWAGDESNLKIHGFSVDGKFIAFEYYGNSDGSGFPYFDFFIVNVPDNKYAIHPVRKRMPDNEPLSNNELDVNKFRANFDKKTNRLLKEFKIHKTIQGKEVSLQNTIPKDYTTTRQSFTYDNLKYTLILKQIETNKDCFYGNGKYFDLRLKSRGKETILQKDKNIPKSRGCAIEYSFKKVLIYKGYISVFLDVMLPGFEGHDTRQMVVTGLLVQ